VPTTTAPATTAPVATTADAVAPDDTQLVQFCFDSEQVYVADSVLEALVDPTPAQVAASLDFLVASAGTATASAPEGMGEQAARFTELATEVRDAFAEYDFDIAQMPDPTIGALDPVVAEIDSIRTDDLIPFLDEACNSPLETLDIQATKVAPVIDTMYASGLYSVANLAGDIRMLVPGDWRDVTGSEEVGEYTFLQAAPDGAAFETSWDAAGALGIAYYIEEGVADPELRIGSTTVAGDCREAVRNDYQDAYYDGKIALYTECGGGTAEAAVLAVANQTGSVEFTMEVVFPDGVDTDVLTSLLTGFAVAS